MAVRNEAKRETVSFEVISRVRKNTAKTSRGDKIIGKWSIAWYGFSGKIVNAGENNIKERGLSPEFWTTKARYIILLGSPSQTFFSHFT